MPFHVKLRTFREAAGISQAELAERAGMSKGGIADLEQGRRAPSWGTVQKLAATLGVTCLEFSDREGDTQDVEPRERGRPRKKPQPKADKPKKK